MKYDVFISYRRDGGDTLAQLIYDRLTYRGYRVFLDIESLNSGKFNEKLLEVIEECKDVLIVLPPKGLDRCNNEGDWVYQELAFAMKCGKNIIPVLMKGFEWPDTIPDKISEIRNYNGIVDNKEYFDAVIDRLTTLLVSKAAIGGKTLKNIGERSRFLQGRVKKKRRIIIGILFLFFVCIATVFLLKNMEKQLRAEERLNTKITLTPSEEMSASEYYDAIKILKERIDILSNGEKYSFEEKEGKIYISIPESVFHNVDVGTTLQSYVTRPTEIYLAGDWSEYLSEEIKEEDRYFHIERSAIESVELVDEVPINVDFDRYELQGVEKEECQFFAVTVNEEVVKEAKAWSERTNFSNYGLYQDCEEFGLTYYYFLEDIFVSDNVLYILDNYQYSNYLNLILHNYRNETFSEAFHFSIEVPVSWEYDDAKATVDSTLYGKNQCNVNKLSSDLIARYDFGTWEDEFTEGEYRDIIIAFKRRLDAIGIPYAFGTAAGDPNYLVVKTDPNYMNSFIQEYLGSFYKIEIRSNFYNVLESMYVDTIEISENDDGTYSIVIVPTETWFSYYKDKLLGELDDEEIIYLCITDGIGIPVTEGELGVSFDGRKFVFEGMSLFGIEKITKRNKYMADFLKALHETEIPANYTLKGKHGEFEVDLASQVIPEPTVMDEVQMYYEKSIGMSEFVGECNVVVESYGQVVNLEVICPEDQPYVEYVNMVFQELYDCCEMNNGETAQICVEFHYGSKDGKATRFYVRNNMNEHCRWLDVQYYYNESKEVMDEFDEVINHDIFYERFSISDYNIDDGYISFQQ